LTLPDRFLAATSDDAPETASENKFRIVDAPYTSGEGNGDTRRRGLVTAIRNRQIRRQSRKFVRPGGAFASRAVCHSGQDSGGSSS
jgi:NADPH-dependent stearoyl-CoA 9-desaturase